jgi:hypothetical protein
MRRYAIGDEERIRLQSQVRDWTGAGLLSTEQGLQLEAELRVPLRRTGRMLRLGLAVFTVVAVAAAVGLVVVLMDVDSERATSMILTVAGAACCVGADRLVSAFRLYRHGVEEALAVSGVALIAVGTGLFVSRLPAIAAEGWPIAAGLATAAIGGFTLYRRFGFRYSAIAAMACAALIPFPLSLAVPARHLLSSATFAAGFAWARRVRREHEDDFVGDDARIVEAAACLGAYLVLNLHVIGGVFGLGGSGTLIPWFKWTTYALVWGLPPLVIWLGVRERERWLIDVGTVALLATLLTNKLYLGMSRNPWDPIVFGVVVAGAAVAIRRWIAAVPGEVRHGFTAARVSGRDGDALAVIGTTATALHPTATSSPERQPPPEFGGGRSGGAGGGASF